MHSLLVVLGLTTFWMFSPEALVLTGNAGGVGTGAGLLVFLCLSVAICFGVLVVRGEKKVTTENSGLSQKKDLVEVIGVSGMIGTALFGSTGILVTAGFTFNEVIYYRFPNFAFAFILLAAALIVSFLSKTIREVLVVLNVSICFIGISALVTYGLFSEPSVAHSFVQENSSVIPLLSLMLVFIGIDRVCVQIRTEPVRFLVVFGLCVLLISGWMYVSARFVAPDRLMASTIPYMIAAGKIGGDPGRMVMAIVIISGSFGAVYGLNRLVSATLRQMYAQNHGNYVEKGCIVLLAIIIASMMAGGVAGTELLEVYIRSSLLLWLLHTALKIFSSAIYVGKEKLLTSSMGVISSTIFLLGSLVLFVNQEKVIVAACFAVAMIIGTVLLGAVLSSLSGLGGPEDIKVRNNKEV